MRRWTETLQAADGNGMDVASRAEQFMESRHPACTE
jgi:hypothetical protein